MLVTLINIIAPVLAIASLGYFWGRIRDKGAAEFQLQFITRLISYIGAPCLIISVINGTRLPVGMLGEMSLLSGVILVGNLLLGAVTIRSLGQRQRSMLPAVVFPNCGNMGLSLCFFAFGEQGLALALMVFFFVSMLQFLSGDILLSRETDLAKRLRRVVGQPIIWSAMVALALIGTGVRLPDWIAATTGLLGDMTIPLMLLTLGYSLSGLQAGDLRLGFLLGSLRVVGGTLVGLAAVFLLGAQGMPAKVAILMSAMPSAVFNYLFALKYDRDAGLVAGVVVISTLISFVTLPLLLALLV